MPYLGRSSNFGVRTVFQYLPSAGDTSVSGADANGKTLAFADGNYVDVYLNGVKLKTGTDYNTTTANTIAGLTALASNDEVTVVVYDAFSLATGFETLGGTFGDDITFNKDGVVLNFGADSDVTITHDPDDGLIFKSAATGDDNPFLLTLQTGETDIAANDVIGAINFQAPDEGTGTDAILVAAGIEAVSEGDFSSSSNATKLSFKTGSSEAASEKMSLSSAGLLTIADDLMIKDGGTIGVATTNDAITISSAGIVTFKDDILIKDGGTIGSASVTDAITIASTGAVTIKTGDFDSAESSLTLESTDTDADVGPTLDLYRNSSSPADDDLLGMIIFHGEDDAGNKQEYAKIRAQAKDVSDGAEDTQLAIQTQVGGAGRERIKLTPTETVFNDDRIDLDFRVESASEGIILFVEASTSRVGIGTSSPTAQLQCEGGSVVFKNAITNIGSTVHHYVNSVNNGSYRVRFDSDDTVVGSIGVGTSSTAFNTSSDYRLKENVSYDFDATTRIKKLKPARFSWIKDKKSDATQDGFIAHEVSDIVPEAVTGTKDAMMALEYQRDDVIPEGKKLGDFKGYSKTEIEPQTLDYSKIVPLITKSLQEALTRIDTLETKVKTLEGG